MAMRIHNQHQNNKATIKCLIDSAIHDLVVVVVVDRCVDLRCKEDADLSVEAGVEAMDLFADQMFINNQSQCNNNNNRIICQMAEE